MYPTRRMIIVALAGVPLALAGGMVSPSFWLIGVAWVIFSVCLFLLDFAFAAGPRSLQFALQAPVTLGVAGKADASLHMSFARTAPSRVELAVDSGNRVDVVPERQTCAVDGRTADAAFTLVPRRRGEEQISNLWARWQGPLGLCWRQRVEAIGRKIFVIPNIATVKDEAVRLFQRETGRFGVRAQLRSGEGSEFSSLREFQTGMDRRMIDWKQSARHNTPLVREFQAEENLQIVFALDSGRQMCEPLLGQPRIDRAIQAMLLLAYVALRLGDRVGVFAFDEKPVIASGTVAGPNAFAVLQRVAAQIDYSTAETNFTYGLTQLSATLQHRAIVVVFTDFSDTISAELMIENVKRLIASHQVLFIAFRDEELEAMARAEPNEPADVSRAILADAMLRERGAVTARLKRLGVDVIDAPADHIGMKLLQAYLAVKQGRG
ncbi:MAG TPA: DUF58 domain-containing protein [Rhizomicrobium sp.]|jgi:uncharacterized protein (DUF58 family)